MASIDDPLPGTSGMSASHPIDHPTHHHIQHPMHDPTESDTSDDDDDAIVNVSNISIVPIHIYILSNIHTFDIVYLSFFS